MIPKSLGSAIVLILSFLCVLSCFVESQGCLRQKAQDGPFACCNAANSSSICFNNIQDAISSIDCASPSIYLDPGVFTQSCAVFNVSRPFNLFAKDPTNKPIIEAAFEFDHSLGNIQGLSFHNVVLRASRGLRIGGLPNFPIVIEKLGFYGVDFIQLFSTELMIKIQWAVLSGQLEFENCSFTTANVTSGIYGSLEFLNTPVISSTKRDPPQLLFNNVNFTAFQGSASLMEIDVIGATNVVIKNSQFRNGATMYFKESEGITITGTTFSQTGFTTTTTNAISVDHCLFEDIQILTDPDSYARSIHIKDAAPQNGKSHWISVTNNIFQNYVPDHLSQMAVSAISFSASPARRYFDSVNIHSNSFIGFDRKGLYAIMDEDFIANINASMNWWGSNTGPYDVCNRKSNGANLFFDEKNKVSNIHYRPWCSTPACSEFTSNRKNCPWPAYLYAIIVLSSILGAAVVVLIGLAIRHFIVQRQYSILATAVEGEFSTQLLRKVKNLDDLCAKYNVKRVLMEQVQITENSIGQGTFGIVHKAVYHPPREYLGFEDPYIYDNYIEVAVKQLKNVWLHSNFDTLGNFLDEIKIMTLTNHPNLQPLIGIVVDDQENVWMVSEFMHHGSLQDLMKRPLSSLLKMDISVDTAYGMSHLHSKGVRVVHRDLKPANVLISKNWVARVADFGTCITTKKDSSEASQIGTTPVYLSPEASLHSVFSEASDIFAFGITLYELWAQEVAYPDLTGGLSTIQEYARKQLDPDLPRLNLLPHPIAEIITACTAFNPEDRPTFQRVLTMLLSCREEIRKNLVTDDGPAFLARTRSSGSGSSAVVLEFSEEELGYNEVNRGASISLEPVKNY